MAETHSPPEDERNSPTAEPVTPEGEPATPKVEPGPGPGPDFHTLTTRATARLRRDRELRLEVAHELRTHLDAAAAEYRTAGYDDPAARAAAAHAFGDPDTLADDLWQAHRRRLRLRAWAWWTVRLTLLPVCLLALGGFVFSGLTYVTQYQNVEAFQDDDDNWIKRRVEARMTAEQRLIYFGDQSADNPVARWEAVRDRYPDEPLYQLQLLRTLLTYHDYPDGVESQEPWQQRISVDRILNEAARGRQLDPDNGIYDLIDAAYLFPLSLPLEPDPALGFSYETPVETGDDNGRATFEPYVFVEPVDEAAMDRLVRVVERAAAKPYISMHAVDLVRHRLAQLPPPRSLAEYMVRVASEVGTLLPHLGHHRAIARLLCAEAVRQAQLGAAGDEAAAQQAYHILETLSLANRNIAASDTLLIELLVSWSIETLVRNTRVVVAQILGDPAALQQAREAAQQLRQLYDRVWREPMARGVTEDRVARGGFLMSTVLPAIPGYDVEVDPFRNAEYTLMDRVALTLGLSGLIVVSLLLSLTQWSHRGWRVWRRPKGHADASAVHRQSESAPKQPGGGAVLLWMGWRRLLAVLIGAVVLPMAGFVVWTMLPWSGRGYGLNHTWWPLLAYLPLAATVAGLLMIFGEAALRRRAQEVGLRLTSDGTAPWGVAKQTWRLLVKVIVVLVTAAWFTLLAVAMVWSLQHQDVETPWALAMGIIALLLMTVWLLGVVGLARLRGTKRPVGAVIRGAMWGIAVAAVLGVGLGVAVVQTVMPADQDLFIAIVIVTSLVIGGFAGFWWVAGQPAATPAYGASALRSLGYVFAAAGLVLVVTVGPALAWRERALVRGVVAATPVWLEQEITRSNARELRAYLAGNAAAAPVMEVGE